jgi:glutamine amidotransferase
LKPVVTIIDYGSGNLMSVKRAFEFCGATVVLTDEAPAIECAERLVLPGVGAFADGMKGLRDRALIAPIQRHAASCRPLLGICLGMQMLMSSSSEFGMHEGLNLIEGEVVPVHDRSAGGEALKIPNIGWYDLCPTSDEAWAGSLLDGLPTGSAVYVVHSYHVVPKQASHLLATYSLGGHPVPASIKAGQIVGCQFHPEKSGKVGLQILAGFLGM